MRFIIACFVPDNFLALPGSMKLLDFEKMSKRE